MYHAASRIFTFSQYLKNNLIKKYKIDPRKVVSVGAGPNFIHLPRVDFF